MSVRIEMADGWQMDLDAVTAEGVHDLFGHKLGPAMLEDAERYVPVDKGRLLRSLDFEVADGVAGLLPELHLGSFPDDEGDVDYAAATELGFHGEEYVRAYVTKDGRHVAAHTRQGNTPEQPYLRPVLYQERDG